MCKSHLACLPHVQAHAFLSMFPAFGPSPTEQPITSPRRTLELPAGFVGRAYCKK